MNGIKKCQPLQSIRKHITELIGIEYTPTKGQITTGFVCQQTTQQVSILVSIFLARYFTI